MPESRRHNAVDFTPIGVRLVMIAVCLVCMILICLSGCTVGPAITQGLDGQSSNNAGLNTSSRLEHNGKRSLTSAAAGPFDTVLQEPGRTDAWSTGQVQRTFTLQRGGDLLSYRSGADFELDEGQLVDPDGKIVAKVKGFKTSASAPLDALARNQAEFRRVYLGLAPEQRAAFRESIEAIAPGAFDVLLKLAGLAGGAVLP